MLCVSVNEQNRFGYRQILYNLPKKKKKVWFNEEIITNVLLMY